MPKEAPSSKATEVPAALRPTKAINRRWPGIASTRESQSAPGVQGCRSGIGKASARVRFSGLVSHLVSDAGVDLDAAAGPDQQLGGGILLPPGTFVVWSVCASGSWLREAAGP